MEVNPTHSIMTELKKKASADKSDKTVKDMIWLLFDTSLLTSGFNLDEPTQFARCIHRMIKLGLSMDDDDDELGDDEDLLPLEEVWRALRMRRPRWRRSIENLGRIHAVWILNIPVKFVHVAKKQGYQCHTPTNQWHHCLRCARPP